MSLEISSLAGEGIAASLYSGQRGFRQSYLSLDIELTDRDATTIYIADVVDRVEDIGIVRSLKFLNAIVESAADLNRLRHRAEKPRSFLYLCADHCAPIRYRGKIEIESKRLV